MSADTSVDIAALRKKLNAVVTDAYEVRQTLTSDSYNGDTETPESLYDALKYTRHVTDRLEHGLVQALLLKARIDKLNASARADVEDAEVSVSLSRNDFVSSRERNIEVNAKTMSQRRIVRQTTDLLTDATSVVESVRVMHRGADSHRREIDTRLRAITLKTSLEH